MTEQQTPEEVILTVPARHLQCGDKVWGFTISSMQNIFGIDGKEVIRKEWVFVVPYTTHTMKVVVEAKDFDHTMFPLTDRGDRHSASARNKALGLPLDLHQHVYKETKVEPIAHYAAGSRLDDVIHFDRGQKVGIKCPDHPGNGTFWSKDPRFSSWFGEGNPCNCSLSKYILAADYNPTRNG